MNDKLNQEVIDNIERKASGIERYTVLITDRSKNNYKGEGETLDQARLEAETNFINEKIYKG